MRAAIALCALTLLFYAPALGGDVLVDRDLFRLFIPDAAFLKECLGELEWPLWNPYQRLGQPFAATLQSQVYYPPHVLLVALLPPARALTVQVMLHVALLSLGAWLLARTLRLGPLAAAVAGLAAGFTPLLTQMTSQLNLVTAAAWTGVLVVVTRRAAVRPAGGTVALAAACWGLCLFAGSPETVVWQGLLALLVTGFGRPSRAGWAALVAALTAGALLASVVLLPAAELAAESTRVAGATNAFEWSATPSQLLSLLLISPRGAPPSDFVPTTFVGVTVVFLALAGAAGKNRAARPFAVAAVALMLLSLGENFLPAKLVLGLPPLHLFRYPSRYLTGAAFCVALLAGFGVEALADASVRRRAALLGTVGTLVAAGALFVAALPGALWAGLVALGIAAASFGLQGRGRVRALGAICLLELVAARLHQPLPAWLPLSTLDHPSALAAQLERGGGARISVDLEDPERSLYRPDDLIAKSRDALYPLRWVEERLEAVEGYGAPEPRLVSQLTDEYLTPRVLFDLASVKHYVRAGEPPFPDLTPAPAIEGLPRVYRSATARPRAFLVQRAEVRPDAEAVRALTAAEHDPGTAVVLGPSATASPLQGESCPSEVRSEAHGHRAARHEVSACADSYLVLGEAHFPGWSARVDGVDVPIERANLLFRAVRVPRGEHEVTLRYRPRSSLVGAAISLLTLVGLIALTAARRYR